MYMNEQLSERKLRILRFIIQEYIGTAEPVGSRTISKNKLLGVSAATIRNEMADLEEMGFLVQPHTSAGRIPSEEAYRLYVNELIESVDQEIDENDRSVIESSLIGNMEQIQGLLEESLALLSRITNYTSLAIARKVEDAKRVRNLNIIRLDDQTAVLIMVMEDGSVKNAKFRLSIPVPEEKMDVISRTINESIRGKYIEEIDERFMTYIKAKIKEYSKLFDTMFEVMTEKIDEEVSFNVFLNGATNIFNFPEFSDLERAKSFLSLMEQKEAIADLIEAQGIEKGNIKIIIGNPSMGEVLENCSIMTADFEHGGKFLGKLGIIGPKRMDYERAYSVMNYITRRLNKLMDESKY